VKRRILPPREREMNKEDFDKLKKQVYEELLESPTPRRPKKSNEKKSGLQSSSGRKGSQKGTWICSKCRTEFSLPTMPCTIKCPVCGTKREFTHD